MYGGRFLENEKCRVSTGTYSAFRLSAYVILGEIELL